MSTIRHCGNWVLHRRQDALRVSDTQGFYSGSGLTLTLSPSASAPCADYNHRSGLRTPVRLLELYFPMPILWLRVALCCYAIGLLYALLALTRTNSLLNRVAVPAMTLAWCFSSYLLARLCFFRDN